MVLANLLLGGISKNVLRWYVLMLTVHDITVLENCLMLFWLSWGFACYSLSVFPSKYQICCLWCNADVSVMWCQEQRGKRIHPSASVNTTANTAATVSALPGAIVQPITAAETYIFSIENFAVLAYIKHKNNVCLSRLCFWWVNGNFGIKLRY